jgi:branched-chain amino acid transport system permease protein
MVAEMSVVPSARSSRARPGLLGVAGRLLAAVPLLAVIVLVPAKNDTFGHVAAYAAIFVMVGLSMNVLTGYTGQISLGHQAFLGLGALTAANVVSSGIHPADPFTFGIGMVCAAAASAAAALLLGAVALRVRGLYLALVTLVFGSVFVSSIFTLPSLNGQDAGVSAYRPSFLATEYRYYLFALVMIAACVYVDVWVRRTKVGRGLVALRENELVAAAVGVNVVGYKLLAFTLSGAMAGLAGGVFAFWSQEFSDKDFTGLAGFNMALTFVVVVVVGGLGNRVGVIAASAFFALVSPLSPFLGWLSSHTGWNGFYNANNFYISNVIGAVLLLQTVILNPGGLGQILRPISRWFGGKPFTLHDPDGDAGPSGFEGGAARA